MNHIYLIDDDVFFNKTLSSYLKKQNFEVSTFFNAETFLEAYKNGAQPDLVVTDYRLPNLNGLDLIKQLKVSNPHVPVILITSYSDVKTAVKSIKLGAYEYITKPLIPDEFVKIIQLALSKKIQDIKIAPAAKPTLIKGDAMPDLWHKIELVSPTNLSVVIRGESGTGKELIAKYIHQNSQRSEEPFISVDCGALPQETALSELFGHVKGAFTGAINTKKGQFELAHKGTLFLDEIGNLSYAAQIMLLRAIQERKIKRLGDEKDLEVDIRLICATNENLETAISDNKFRQDLFYRINEFPLHLKPLRERFSDLEFFINQFATEASHELQKPYTGIDPKIIAYFKQYSWPGNLRELKNYIKRAVLMSADGFINQSLLPELHIESSDVPSLEIIETSNTHSLKSKNEALEIETIKNTLEKNFYNKTKTANELNITRATLYKKIKKYNLLDH